MKYVPKQTKVLSNVANRIFCDDFCFFRTALRQPFFTGIFEPPKMKNFPLFTHPQAVPNLYELLSTVEHKISYVEENRKPLTYTAKTNTMEVIRYTTYFKTSSFVRKDLIKVCQVKSGDRIFRFG